jgi:hypothetical protein
LRRGATAAWLCGLWFPIPLHAAPASTGSFDYLYIEASSGSSAGGHAAVRFGDRVYHFQHESPGIIAPAVQSWESFDLDYRGHGNRPIHVQRILVDPAAAERLRDAFHRRLVVQRSHMELLAAAGRDVELLAALGDGAAEGRGGVALPGAGYFFDDGANGERRQDAIAPAAFLELRRELDRSLGDGTVSRRRRELRSRIARLAPPRPPPVETWPREGRIAPAATTLSGTYSDLLLEWLALTVIAGEAAPVPEAFRTAPGPLSPREHRALEERETGQRRVVLELLGSRRRDRGHALLIALARLVAARTSRDGGALVVLDTFSDRTPSVPAAALAPLRRRVERILGERRAEMEEARAAAFDAPAAAELPWSRFEVSVNVVLELEGALAGRPLRRHQDELVPLRGSGRRPEWPAPRLSPSRWRAAMDEASGRRAGLESELRRLHGYELVGRNCVTEIFRTLDGADAGGALGGRVSAGDGASFIPFVSARAVRAAYRVGGEAVLPSYREQALRRRLATSGSWRVRLREETAPASTLVPFDPREEIFLFFSTGAVAVRPLLGLSNVLFGLGGIAGGLLAAPFDGATLLRAAGRGVLYSAPELVFINIRKGTVPLLPSDWSTSGDPAE